MDDALKIGFIVILICFAGAIVAWDPRIFFPEYQTESGVEVEEKSEGVDVDLNATYISWGVLDPGGFAERGLLIENRGKAALLSIHASNFTPVEAEKFMNLSWSLEPGFILEPQKNVAAFLRLDVSALIQNITTFSFDITITANEAT